MIKSLKYGSNKNFGMMSIWYQDLSKREFAYQIICYKKAEQFGLTRAQATNSGNNKIIIKF